MKSSKFMWIAVLAALVAGPGLAETNAVAPGGEGAKCDKHAMRGKGEGKQGEHKGIGHALAGELGLSSNKAAEIKGLMEATRQDMMKLREARDQARSELDQLFKADPLDEKAILAAAGKLAQVNAELTLAMTKGRLAVNAALTPEQRARMHELRDKAVDRFKEHKEGRRGHKRSGEEGGQGSNAPAAGGGGM